MQHAMDRNVCIFYRLWDEVLAMRTPGNHKPLKQKTHYLGHNYPTVIVPN